MLKKYLIRKPKSNVFFDVRNIEIPPVFEYLVNSEKYCNVTEM